MGKSNRIKMKTYNLVIPMKYNNGKRIEKDKINQTFGDIRTKFSECSWTMVVRNMGK